MGKQHKDIKKPKSVKINAMLNMVKQCSAIIFPLITFPYITHILHADNYGKVNFATTYVSYFSLIAAMGISTYAIREGTGFRDNKKKFNEFASQMFTINIVSTVMAYLLLFFSLIMFRRLDSYRNLIAICSINIIFVTLGQDWINSVFEDYLYITIRYIVTHTVSVILIIIFVQKETDTIIYVLLTICSTVIANIFNMLYIQKYAKIRVVKSINIKKHLMPIMILFVNAATITVYLNFDITMLGMMKGDTEVGIYGAAAKIYALVKQVLNAFAVVAIPRMSFFLRNERLGEFYSLFKKALNALLILVVPAVVGLFMVSKQLLLIMSGEEYVSGHIALKILSVSLLFAVMASLITQCVLVPCREEKTLFKITLFSALLNTLLNAIFIPLFSYNGAAITTLLAEISVFVLGYMCVRDKIDITGISKTIQTSLLGCITIVFVCLICKGLLADTFICLLISVGASVIMYGAILLGSKNEIVFPVTAYIVKKWKQIRK